MFTIDTTVHLSDVVMVGGGIVSFIVMFQRINLILNRVVEDVKELKTDRDKHHDWLIELKAKAPTSGRH